MAIVTEEQMERMDRFTEDVRAGKVCPDPNDVTITGAEVNEVIHKAFAAYEDSPPCYPLGYDDRALDEKSLRLVLRKMVNDLEYARSRTAHILDILRR